MEKRTSAFARIFAALALAAAVVVTVVAISGALSENSSKSGNRGNHQTSHKVKKERKQPRAKAATYEVQSGDTLISIAHKTGIPVAELEALNPEIDPQILIAGETLKLR
jgi:LysM repeat protein